jgi:hypothetical protein
MGILGAMRRDDDELTKMSIDDIKDEHSVLIVAVPDTKTDIKRTFTCCSVYSSRVKKRL